METPLSLKGGSCRTAGDRSVGPVGEAMSLDRQRNTVLTFLHLIHEIAVCSRFIEAGGLLEEDEERIIDVSWPSCLSRSSSRRV